MADAHEFIRLAVDPIRLAVLGRAAAGPVDLDELASALNVPARRIQQAVAKLRSAGLLDDELRLNREALRVIAEDLPGRPPPAPQVTGAGTWTDDEIDILGRFFTGTRLDTIPGSRSKRLVVLDRLAQEFEPGLRYDEREINFTLQLWHPDYASLRRYLVDEGFLTRADGVYWRTGGRFEQSDD